MQELIQKLMAEAGLTQEQAMKAVQTTQEFIRTKVPPQMSGVIDSFFSSNFSAATASAAMPPKEEDWMDKAKHTASDAADKAQDFAKDAGKKMGEWADKAEDMAGDAVNKLKGFFNKEDDNTKPA